MEIDYAGLTTAFQDANTSDYSYWLNTQTGDVLMVDDWSEGEARQLASPYDTETPPSAWPGACCGRMARSGWRSKRRKTRGLWTP